MLFQFHSSNNLHTQTAAGEADQSSADTETSTRAGRGTHARGIDVQDGKGGRRDEGNHANLLGLHRLARENVRGNRHGETLQEVLDDARQQIAHIETRGSGLGLGLHFYSLTLEIFLQVPDD